MSTLSMTTDAPRRPLWPDLMVIIPIGLLSSALTAFALAWLEVRAHVSMFRVSIFSYVPVGGILCGSLAASGYFGASRLLRRTPWFPAFASTLASSVATYIAVYYFEYRMISVKGTPVSAVMGFGAFFNTAVRSTWLNFTGTFGSGPIGPFGYPLALLPGFGFLVGGAGTTTNAMAKPLSCDSCSRFLPPVVTAAAYGDESALASEFESLDELARAGHGPACLTRLGQLSQQEANYKLALDVSFCAHCRRQYSRLRLLRFVTPHWVQVKGVERTDQVISTDCSLRA